MSDADPPSTLHEAEIRYRQLAESSSDGIVLQKNGEIIFCNRAFALLLGFGDTAQVVGRSFIEMVDRNHRSKCLERVRTLVSEDTCPPAPFQLNLKRADGKQIPVDISSAIVRVRGEPAVQSVVRDLTERRQAQVAMIQQARFVITVLESLAHPFYVIDVRDYSILLSNSATGFPDDKTTRTCYELTHDARLPCSGPDHVCPLRQVIKTGQPVIVEHTHTTAKGQLRRVEVHGHPVFDKQHNVVQMIEYTIDVSDKFRLQEQLQLAQRLSAVGQIAGGIAHDFNNLVTVIMSASTLLKEHCAKESAVCEAVETIKHAASTAGKMTSGLLAFSRQQPMQLEPVVLSVFVADLEPMVRSLLGEGMRLEINPRGTDNPVDADKSQLERVLINLVLNARDAMPDGGTLRISTSEQVLDPGDLADMPWGEAGSYVVLRVSDTGVGMDERARLQAFEPFFTTKHQGKGTGLGLASVYGIVKKHGGMIKIDSEIDHGTSVTIYLPARAPSTMPGQPLSREIVSGGGETVLIVEDQTGLRRIVQRYLDTLGYATVVAENGAQALSQLDDANLDIDLVFSDLVMPVMGGQQLYDKVRRRQPTLPFLFCSGFEDNQIQKTGAENERVSFIGKPYELPSLAKAIRKLLDQRS